MNKKNLFIVMFYCIIVLQIFSQNFNNLFEMQKLISDPRHHASCFNYADGGVKYDFIIWEGEVHYYEDNIYKGIFKPQNSYIAQYITYDVKRDGEKFEAPLFDMIAADNNRVIVKVADTGTDVYTPATLMWAQIVDEFPNEFEESSKLKGESPLSIPGFYTKLNPEYNGERNLDNLYQLNKYHNHPAVKNFKKLKNFPSKINGDVLMVIVDSKVWYEIDARPPRNSNDDFDDPFHAAGDEWQPNNFLEMDTLTYDSFPLECTEHYLKIYEVIDIGVSNPHRWEHVKTLHGGRIHSYQYPKKFEDFISMPLTEDFFLFPGDDVVDGGGFSDGTCNFYMIAKIKIDLDNINIFPFNEINKNYETAYAVLWLDEQEYFSERWRIVHPVDHLYNALRGGFANIFPVLKGYHILSINFKNFVDNYWTPYHLLNQNSRLATSRYGLFVTDDYKIYSTAYMWGTTDFNWRGRSYPQSGSYKKDTLKIRDDMTLIMEGKYDINQDGDTDDELETGYWYQKYLPADNVLDEKCNLDNYSHPWNFVAEEVYKTADNFYKFGIYDKDEAARNYYKYKGVDDRCQYYQIGDFTLRGDLYGCTTEDLEGTVWDTGEVNPNFLGADKEYQETVKVKLVNDPILGIILKINHPRDDDIDKDSIAFLNPEVPTGVFYVPITLKYVSGGNFVKGTTGKLIFSNYNLKKIQDWEAPVVQKTVIHLKNGLISVEITSKTSEGTVDQSLRKAKIGVINDNGEPEILAEFDIKPSDFNGYTLSKNLNLTREQYYKFLEYSYFPKDFYKYGISIWFEDITGHKNTAEKLIIHEDYPGYLKLSEAKKVGPVGGDGGKYFNAKLQLKDGEKYRRLCKITAYQGNVVDSLRFFWKNDKGEIFESAKYGGKGGKIKIIEFGEDEYITKVKVWYGIYVDKIIFYTNKDNKKIIGGDPLFSTSRTFDFNGRECHGFFGREQNLIDKIGFYTYTSEFVGRY